jgi:hypothetical protein
MLGTEQQCQPFATTLENGQVTLGLFCLQSLTTVQIEAWHIAQNTVTRRIVPMNDSAVAELCFPLLKEGFHPFSSVILDK